jgi:hypothetical protein
MVLVVGNAVIVGVNLPTVTRVAVAVWFMLPTKSMVKPFAVRVAVPGLLLEQLPPSDAVAEPGRLIMLPEGAVYEKFVYVTAIVTL